MDIITFLVSVFCLVDDFPKDKPLRQRGPHPTLQESKVMTMEIVGEFLDINTDSGILEHFENNWSFTFT